VNRSKFTAQEASDGTCAEFKSYEVEMQVSRGMDTKVSQEVIICGVEKVFGINVQRPRHAEGMSGDGGASFARSYSPADFDTTQVLGF
jgi:hypothetical protein